MNYKGSSLFYFEASAPTSFVNNPALVRITIFTTLFHSDENNRILPGDLFAFGKVRKHGNGTLADLISH